MFLARIAIVSTNQFANTCEIMTSKTIAQYKILEKLGEGGNSSRRPAHFMENSE